MLAHGPSEMWEGSTRLLHFLHIDKLRTLISTRLIEDGDATLDEKRRFVVVTSTISLLCCLAGIIVLAYWYNVVDEILSPSFHGATDYMGLTSRLRTTSAQSLKSSGGSAWYNLHLKEPNSSYLMTLEELLRKKVALESSCDSELTTAVKLEGLPEGTSTRGLYFQTDVLHKLTLVAYREDGVRRCSGGDAFELDFHDHQNIAYRSRLPIVDFGNGSYGLELMVPSRFAGMFQLVVYLGFSNWRGLLMLDPDPNYQGLVSVLTQGLEFRVEAPEKDRNTKRLSRKDKSARFTNLSQCTQSDFLGTSWHGRWTTSWFNQNCFPNDQYLYRCLPEAHYWCEEPWCFGPVGKLDSNGWEYSIHCSFKIFGSEEAWDCLNGRWFFSWGDSTSVDTLRNLLLFILDWPLPPGHLYSTFKLDRRFDTTFVNPRRIDQVFRISTLWNGGHSVNDLFEGMKSLRYQDHQSYILSHFNGTRWPDTLIMNSALHDAWSQDTVEQFSDVSDFVIQWWMELYDKIPVGRKPLLIWKTQVATSGFTGQTWQVRGNVNRMETFNLIFVEKLRKAQKIHNVPVAIVDAFDLTFPWHYSQAYSDGAHYGLPPAGLWYFTDIMLAQIYLTAACPSTAAAPV